MGSIIDIWLLNYIFTFLNGKTDQKICWQIRFSAIVHLQKAPITASSENMPHSQFFTYMHENQKYYHLFKQNGLSAHIEKIHITWSYSIKILVNIWNHGKKLQDLQGQNHWKILADIFSIFLFNFLKFKLISHISSSLLLFCLIFCILCCWLQSHSENMLSKKEALLQN